MKKLVILLIIGVIISVSGSNFAFGQSSENTSFPWIDYDLSDQEKIPTWVKDVAVLWVDDKITNDDFLNTIKYLKESNIIKIIKITNDDLADYETNLDKSNEIIQWYSSASDALQNPVKSNFVMPVIEGQIDSFRSKVPVEITVVDPNGESKTTVDITRDGKYSVTPKDPEPILSGMYVTEIRVDGALINILYSFLDEEKTDIQNISLDDSKKEIPAWIKNTAVWWTDDKITNDDFLQGIRFLVKTDVIPPKQIDLSMFTAKIWSDVNSNAIKTSKLTALSNSDTIDISKYDTNQECRVDLAKNNKNTILNMKQCDKITSNSHIKIPKMYDTIDRIVENRDYRQITPQEQNKRQQELENYTSPQDCMVKSKANDGVISVSEKALCDQVNRTWAVDTIIYDNYGNKVGTQALNNCNDSNCYSYGSYNSGYYGGYDYGFNMDAEVQYALNRADHYAYQSLDALDTYANQWVSGQISYGEYERKAMASMDYYGNQYAYEMEDYWDSKYGYYP